MGVWAVEAAHDLRQHSEGPPVRFDDVMDALKSLDAKTAKITNYGKLISRAQRTKVGSGAGWLGRG